MDRQFRLPRHWSNQELRRIGPLCRGAVVNVSGWLDDDKEGGKYKNYFPGADTYSLTNYGGVRGGGSDGEIILDLEQPIPSEVARRFDVVFNHTTLEHVFEVRCAFEALCELSRDIVIVVVPFAQPEHYTDSFGDYWRFTPRAIDRMFEANGFRTVYSSVSPDRDAGIYVFSVGARDPDLWRDRLPAHSLPRHAGDWIGRRPSAVAMLQALWRFARR